MDRCLKDEATAKNFVWNKSSSHSQEKLERPGRRGHDFSLMHVANLVVVLDRDTTDLK